jgi:hypothetical protein
LTVAFSEAVIVDADGIAHWANCSYQKLVVGDRVIESLGA